MFAKENMPRCLSPCYLCCLNSAGLLLPACNAQAHGGEQDGGHSKGKHCRAAGKESTLCAIPKGQLRQAIGCGSTGQDYSSPTPLEAMCTPHRRLPEELKIRLVPMMEGSGHI